MTWDERNDKEEVLYIDVGFVIGKSRKECNDWYWKRLRNKRVKETGKCGLEGLLFAIRCLQWIEETYDGLHIVIRVGFADDKRKSAYRRLLKYGYEYREGHGYCKPLSEDLIYVKYEEE